MSDNGLITGADKKCRCWWCGQDPLYIEYHDKEWGSPVADDVRLFEKICLEGFQAGLSWITILRKRENFRRAFIGFDLKKLSKFTQKDVERLLKDEGIIRHRGKIESAVNNAGRALELQKEYGSLAAYFWSWEPGAHARPKTLDFKTLKTLGKTETSIALSKDLKKRGWSFVGPTTVYAFMQAMGMVNDHIEGCGSRATIEKKRKNFTRPS
ncbi:MAG: DNA-3-methyladenine glycosylase I [Micavibrio aeruginosavorus]|uniref:DNA-3-methyladenine glycosylase I n=1 Tax=Micavibrio aeruginosavorus TaxID=349221 RepID=A0A2W5PL91_9BACT|nr:MAG: DNA-3-methyladenine glycosylase I [Micavibrio aeruginosavorus]